MSGGVSTSSLFTLFLIPSNYCKAFKKCKIPIMDLGILINNEKLYLVEIGPNFVSSTVIRGNSDIIIIKFISAINAKYCQMAISSFVCSPP